MNAADPVATLLAGLDRPVAPRREFVHALRERLLVELSPRVARPARRRTARFALIGIALALLLAGVATATYLLTRSAQHTSLGPARNGPLTVARGGNVDGLAGAPPSKEGRWKTIWRCPPGHGCGIPTAIAWSPDGRRLAVAIPVWGRPNPDAGWYVVDTRTSQSRQIPAGRFGCHEQRDLAWSYDGRWIAYACPSGIYKIRPDGTERVAVTTAAGGFSSPSWSPDARRIVFALRQGSTWRGASSLYIVNFDGSGLRKLADGGTAPSWSPDGRRIAFRAGCGGIELIAPSGRVVTPAPHSVACPAFGLPGIPLWSPDGKQIAIATHLDRATRGGIYLMNADGSRLHKVSSSDWRGGFGVDRPAWRPLRGRVGARAGVTCKSGSCL